MNGTSHMKTSPSSVTTAMRAWPVESETIRRPARGPPPSPTAEIAGVDEASQLVQTSATPSRVRAPLNASPATTYEAWRANRAPAVKLCFYRVMRQGCAEPFQACEVLYLVDRPDFLRRYHDEQSCLQRPSAVKLANL